MKHGGWNGTALTIAGGIHAGKNSAQTFEDEFIHESATVVADINDQALFPNLREILLNKCVKTGTSHIRQVNVADLAAGGCVYLLAVGFNHVEFAQIVLVVDRLDLDVV